MAVGQQHAVEDAAGAGHALHLPCRVKHVPAGAADSPAARAREVHYFASELGYDGALAPAARGAHEQRVEAAVKNAMLLPAPGPADAPSVGVQGEPDAHRVLAARPLLALLAVARCGAALGNVGAQRRVHEGAAKDGKLEA